MPHQPVHAAIIAPITLDLGEGRCTLHIFSQGYEVLHSEMPFGFRESALDRMVAARIHGVRNQGVKPFVGPSPECTPAQQKAGGNALVDFRIAPRKRPGPKIVSATDPALGTSALAAIRQWRFLPASGTAQPFRRRRGDALRFGSAHRWPKKKG